jgi:hypothetical protein
LPLDQIAKKILQTLDGGPRSADYLATACTGGANRMTSPRLVWLEGLGLVENMGGDVFGLTDLGQSFLRILD